MGVVRVGVDDAMGKGKAGIAAITPPRVGTASDTLRAVRATSVPFKAYHVADTVVEESGGDA